jgi:hypothetical protein
MFRRAWALAGREGATARRRKEVAMTRKQIGAVLGAVVLAVAAPFLTLAVLHALNAETQAAPAANGQQDTIKWEQLPDLTDRGVDVYAANNPGQPLYPAHVLADDFPCTQTGPITQIEFWGSWYGDVRPEGVLFTLSIHSNDLGPPSHPSGGPPLWTHTYALEECDPALQQSGVPEGFFIPSTGEYQIGADDEVWRYACPGPDPLEFTQQGTPQQPVTYWLDVQASYTYPNPGAGSFGWKTSPEHWQDNAVWAIGTEPGPPPLAWSPLTYPSGHPYAGQAIDLAFRIWGPAAEADKTVVDIAFDDASNYPNQGAPVPGNWFGVKVGYDTSLSVTSMDQNLGPDVPADAEISFYADIPEGCVGRWLPDPATFPADLHTRLGDPNVGSSGIPVPPPVPGEYGGQPGFETDLHFQTLEYEMTEPVGPPIPITRFFQLVCFGPGDYTFTLCNRADVKAPDVDPNPDNNLLCEELTVHAISDTVAVDKQVLDVVFDDASNYPYPGPELIPPSLLNVSLGANTMISVTSSETNLGPQVPVDAEISFYANIPQGCEAQFGWDTGVNGNDILTVDGDPGTPSSGTPTVPGWVAGPRVVDLHFQTAEYDITEPVGGPPLSITRFFQLRCSEAGTKLFMLCNRADAKSPLEELSPWNNLLCEPLTVQVQGTPADLEKLDLYVKPFYCGDTDMDGGEAAGERRLPGTGTCCDGANNGPPDGLIDGQDPKCWPYINEDPIDGLDNDDDGLIDEDPYSYGGGDGGSYLDNGGQSCPWNGDDDCDGAVDEDPKNNIDDDNDCPPPNTGGDCGTPWSQGGCQEYCDEDPANGFLGIDTDADGLVDEDGGGTFDMNGDTEIDAVQLEGWDDDGDTRVDEDPLDSPAALPGPPGYTAHEPHYMVKEVLINHGPNPSVLATDVKQLNAPAWRVDAREDGLTTCNDGLDNDGDGYADAADLQCLTTHVWEEAVGLHSCNDGLDNGADGPIDEAESECQTETEVSVECWPLEEVVTFGPGVTSYIKPPSTDPILLSYPWCAQYYDPAHFNKCVPCKIPVPMPIPAGPCSMLISQINPQPGPGYCIAADSVQGPPGWPSELGLQEQVQLPMGMPVQKEHQSDLACSDQTSLHEFTIRNELQLPGGITDPNTGNNSKEMEMLVACVSITDAEARNLVMPPDDDPIEAGNQWDVEVSTSEIKPVSVDVYNNGPIAAHLGAYFIENSPGLGIIGVDPGGQLADTDGDGWADAVEATLVSNPNNPDSRPENLHAWVSPGSCSDGVDNDADISPGMDLADPKCADSDGDGYSDFYEMVLIPHDPLARFDNTKTPEHSQLPWNCGDGLDNDQDGNIDAAQPDYDGKYGGDCSNGQLRQGVRPPVTCASGWQRLDANADTREDGTDAGGTYLRGDGSLRVMLTTGFVLPPGGPYTQTRNLVFHCFAPGVPPEDPAPYPTETVEVDVLSAPPHVLDANLENNSIDPPGTFNGIASCEAYADLEIASWDFGDEVPPDFYVGQTHVYETTKTIHNIGPDAGRVQVSKSMDVPVNCDGSLVPKQAGEKVTIAHDTMYKMPPDVPDWTDSDGGAVLYPDVNQTVYARGSPDVTGAENELAAELTRTAEQVPVSVYVDINENFGIHCDVPGTYTFEFGNGVTLPDYPDICDPDLGNHSRDVSKTVVVQPAPADLEKVDVYVAPFYCGDSDMDGDEATGALVPPGTGTCCDGVDNDSPKNGLTDGRDPKCLPHINEDPVGGGDDDGDTLVDEDWPALAGATCPWNGDDDCDGAVDEDPMNGLDDDGDTGIDEDPADGFLGIDNDGDFLVDEDGGGTFDMNGDTLPDAWQFEDVDDDGDTSVDEDPLDSPIGEPLTAHEPHYLVNEVLRNNGPTTPVLATDLRLVGPPYTRADAKEDGLTTCNDGLDNDGDTYCDIQYDACWPGSQPDPQCLTTHLWEETPTVPSCQDTLDNGGDTQIDALDSDCQTLTEASVECENPTDVISIHEGVQAYVKLRSDDPWLQYNSQCSQYYDPEHSNKCVPCKIALGMGPWSATCADLNAFFLPGFCIAVDSAEGVPDEVTVEQQVELPAGSDVITQHQSDLSCEGQTSLHKFLIGDQLQTPAGVVDPNPANNSLMTNMLVGCTAFADGTAGFLTVPESPWDVEVNTPEVQTVSVVAVNNGPTTPADFVLHLQETSPGLGIAGRDEDGDTLVDEDGPPWNWDNDGDGRVDEDPAGMVDSDGDGWADNVETVHFSMSWNPSSTPEGLLAPGTCDDNVDNDGWLGKDLADPKCQDADGDGYSDFLESYFASNRLDPTKTPEHANLPWTCADGLDNDGDLSCDSAGCDSLPAESDGPDPDTTWGDCSKDQLENVLAPVTCASGWVPQPGDSHYVYLAGNGALTVGLNIPVDNLAGARNIDRDLIFHCFMSASPYPKEWLQVVAQPKDAHVVDLNQLNDGVATPFEGEARECAHTSELQVLGWDFGDEALPDFHARQQHVFRTTKTIHNWGPDAARVRVLKSMNVPANCDGSVTVSRGGEIVKIAEGIEYNVNGGHNPEEEWDVGPATLTGLDVTDVVYVKGVALPALLYEISAEFILTADAVPVSSNVPVEEDFDIYCRLPGQEGIDDDVDTLIDEDWEDGEDNDADTLVDEDPTGYTFQFSNVIGLPDWPDFCEENVGDNSAAKTITVQVQPAAADKKVVGVGWDISASDRNTTDPDLDIWTSTDATISVQSWEGNLGPSETDSTITFLANVPAGCEGRWLPNGTHEYELYDPANPLDQIHGPAHRDAKVPGDGNPATAESALHIPLFEPVGAAFFPTYNFELRCLADGVYTFTFCNKAEPDPPTEELNPADNWLCHDLTVTSADCSSTVDTDGDTFKDNIECYLPTDQSDNCRDGAGDDAWPLDNNIDTFVTVVGDVLRYSNRIGSHGPPSPSPNWLKRLDLNMDNNLTVVGDVLKFSGKIGSKCT